MASRGFKKFANQFCVLHISSIQSGVELEFASRFHSQTSQVNQFGNNDQAAPLYALIITHIRIPLLKNFSGWHTNQHFTSMNLNKKYILYVVFSIHRTVPQTPSRSGYERSECIHIYVR